MADSLYYTYIVDRPASEAFFVPDGFEANVEVHLWGAGGGGGYASSGGGGGYVKSIVTVAEGDFFEITVGGGGKVGSRDVGGAGGQGAGLSTISYAYGFGGGAGGTGIPYPGSDDQNYGAGGGGGGATAVIVNGVAVAVAAGGGGGGGGYSYQSGFPGLPGGAAGRFTTTSSGGIGVAGYAASGGGGGGYFGGEAGGVNTSGPGGTGDDAGRGGAGYGGQSLGDLSIPGSGTTGGGRTTIYAPTSPPYGNAGYDGYAILIFKQKFKIYNKINSGNVQINFSGNISANVGNYITQTSSGANAIVIAGTNTGNTLSLSYLNANVFTLTSGNITASPWTGNARVNTVDANVHPTSTAALGTWKSVDKVWYKTSVPGILSNVATQTFAVVSGPAEYTVPGTYSYTVPADVTSIRVRLVGGGGGSSSYNAGCNYGASNSGGGGGGSGGYQQTTIPVTPGDVITVTVGAGGVRGGEASVCYYGTNAGSGGNTSIQSGIIGTLVATGGSGATVGWEFNGGPAYGGNQTNGAPGVRNGGYGGLPAGNNGAFGGNQGDPTNGLGGTSPYNGYGRGGDGGRPTNAGGNGYVSIQPLTGKPFNSFVVPSGVNIIYVEYMTPTGLVTSSMPTTPGETLAVTLGDFGEPSTVRGLSGTLSLPAYDTQVFSYSGRVDHIIAQDVQVATATPTSYSGSGSNGTLTAGAAAAGITYNVTYEGWHGDLGATISITPVLISTLIQPIRVYAKSGSGRQFPGAHTYQQQPSASNGYIMNDYQGDYDGDEGSYSWTTNLQQQGWLQFTYSVAYAPGTWLPINQVYYKDGSIWKPLISTVDIKALVAKTLIYKGLTTDTFTVPAGTTKVYARLIGGGGGGGGLYSNNGAVRGLPGQIVQGAIEVTPGDVLTISVGGGGGGGEDYIPPAPSGGGGGGCKIICTKLHELGYLPDNIYAADELFGEWLRENDPYAYYGYVKWASVVVDWMESDGPQCMFWIRDKDKRGQAQRELAIKWARRIATPWAEHMAYKMGVGETDNRAGRMIMTTGMWISRLIGKYTKTTEPSKSVVLGYVMWATFGVFWLLAGIK